MPIPPTWSWNQVRILSRTTKPCGTTWPSRYLGASKNSYPNAYPIDAERAKKGHVSRIRVIENIALRPTPFTYEPGGRRFESCRAHHRIRNLRRTCLSRQRLVVA